MSCASNAKVPGDELALLVWLAAPAVERILRLLLPWDRARLRAVSRALAAAVPAETCAPCFSAMLRRGGPALFRYDDDYLGYTPANYDVYDAVVADNPHAVRWLCRHASISGLPSTRKLVKLAVRCGSITVLCALLDAHPRHCDTDVLHMAVTAGRERESLELLRRILRTRDDKGGPERRIALDRVANAAARAGLPGVVEAILRTAAPGDRTRRLVNRELFLQDPERERIAWAIRAGDVARAELLIRAATCPPVTVLWWVLLDVAAHSSRAYDMLCWTRDAMCAGGCDPDGREAEVPGWRDRVFQCAIHAHADTSVGALRWLVDCAGFVPCCYDVMKAMDADNAPCVGYLARHICPALSPIGEILAYYLFEQLVRALEHGHRRTAEALADALADGATPANADDDMPVLLQIGSCADPELRAYAVAVLRRRGLVSPLPHGGEFLRMCDRESLTANQLAVLASAGYRLDADRTAWLDWLWPERARKDVPAVLVLYAYRLHARYTRRVRACTDGATQR